MRESLTSEDAADIRAKTDRLQSAFHRVSEQMYERAQAEQQASAQSESANGAGAESGDAAADEEVVDAEVVDDQR